MLQYYRLTGTNGATITPEPLSAEAVNGLLAAPSPGGGPAGALTEAPGGSDFWINLAAPESAEVEKVAAELDTPLDFLTDSLDPAERPHTMSEGEVKLVICKASAENPAPDGIPYLTIPLGVILRPGAVITVCRHAKLAGELLAPAFSPAAHGSFSRSRVQIALTILQQSSLRFTKHLQRLDDLSEEVEKRMMAAMRNEDLARMMQIQKSLVYFATSLRGNSGVLDKLSSNQLLSLQDKEVDLLTDAQIECKQAADMAEIYLQIISSISDTSASMISNNMNAVMKFLAAITLILTIPMIVVGLYGMNVPLPFQNSPLALLGIGAFTVVLCWVMWIFLFKKHWT